MRSASLQALDDMEKPSFALRISPNPNIGTFTTTLHRPAGARVFVADPALGKVEYSKAAFCKHWMQDDNGIALVFELKK